MTPAQAQAHVTPARAQARIPLALRRNEAIAAGHQAVSNGTVLPKRKSPRPERLRPSGAAANTQRQAAMAPVAQRSSDACYASQQGRRGVSTKAPAGGKV